MKILADTGAWIALADKNDQYHKWLLSGEGIEYDTEFIRKYGTKNLVGDVLDSQ